MSSLDLVEQDRRVDPVITGHPLDRGLEADDRLGQMVARPAEVPEVMFLEMHALAVYPRVHPWTPSMVRARARLPSTR